MSDDQPQSPAGKPRYVWPWFVAAALVLGIVLAVVAMRREVRRVQEQRQYEMTPAR